MLWPVAPSSRISRPAERSWSYNDRIQIIKGLKEPITGLWSIACRMIAYFVLDVPVTSALCHSAQVDRTALLTQRCRSSAFCCCGSVDLEFAAWQPPWPRAESQHFQVSTEDTFYQILTTKRTKRIRDFLGYALYKRINVFINLHFTDLLTYYRRSHSVACHRWTRPAWVCIMRWYTEIADSRWYK